MPYTEEQLEVLEHAKSLLKTVGLGTADLLDIPSSPLREIPQCIEPEEQTSLSKYTPPPARVFTSSEIASGAGKITRKRIAQSIIEHPLGAIVEYPETGVSKNSAVAHVFPIDPMTNFINPRGNIQYSLGDGRGIHYAVNCYLLRDSQGKPVKCKQTKATCSSIKQCAYVKDIPMQSTSIPPSSFNAQKEVFMKTLGFFCALQDQGCCISSIYEDITAADTNIEEDINEDPRDILLWAGSSDLVTKKKCKGGLLLDYDTFKRPFIRCEYYGKHARGHLILRNLTEFDITYLRALIYKNSLEIQNVEQAALSNGYGPLAPCQFTAACRLNRSVCENWHRSSTGILERGTLVNLQNCSAQFEIYEPHDLQVSPFILLVCRGPHTHPNPMRVKTPETTSRFFSSLLEHLEWRLAEATPRRILLDAAFMTLLKQNLSWKGISDPTLSDIHPSLANFDHVARLINKLRFKQYPQGTGLEGARFFLSQQRQLPPDEQYLRCVETYQNPSDGKFYVIVCMFKAMSLLLQRTQRPSIDTSFKRLSNWQEFEIEAWFSEYNCSIVVARAFTTSQSAEAHRILFRRIFEIVKQDTGECVLFRHIHGTGFDTVTADGHRGQALGLGLYCQDLCCGMMGYCAVEWTRPLYALSATEHLARMYRYCFAHYKRHIHNLRGHVSSEIRNAMLSLASSEPLPNLEAVLTLIRSGGKKAIDWLNDKESSDRMALAALYQPASKIPVDVWRAAPYTSNGNEQAHRNINRDGTKLTLLAGIMRGLQYDSRAVSILRTYLEEASLREKLLAATDSEITTAGQKLLKLQNDIQNIAADSVRAWENLNPNLEILQRRLQTKTGMFEKKYQELSKIISRGSGSIKMVGIIEPKNLFNRNILTLVNKPAKEQNSAPTASSIYLNANPHMNSPFYIPTPFNGTFSAPGVQLQLPYASTSTSTVPYSSNPEIWPSVYPQSAYYTHSYYSQYYN